MIGDREYRSTALALWLTTNKIDFVLRLIRVALNLNPLEHIQLDLKRLTRRQGIEWVAVKVTALDPQTKKITVEEKQIINYDYLAIALVLMM